MKKAGAARRTGGGGGCGNFCLQLISSFVLAIPIALAISYPLATMLAKQQQAASADHSQVGARSLRHYPVVAASVNAGDWPAADLGVFGALNREDIRLELVNVDVGTMRHYVGLCDATQPAEFHLGALTAYEQSPHVAMRAPHPEAPVTCASAGFFFVDMRDEAIADDLLDYIYNDEPWCIELWVGILSADRCRPLGLSPGGRVHACQANFAAALGGKKPLVLDIGANHGFYGLLSARLGYRTIAVDPQPHCVEYVRVAGAASGFSRRLSTVNGFLAAEGHLPDGSGTMSVKVRSGCWGTFPTPTGEHVKKHFDAFPGGNASLDVPVLDPNSLIGDDEVVVLMKIDTEGAELGILRALGPALKAGRILNLMVEVNKGFHDPSAGGKFIMPAEKIKEVIETLTWVAQLGYTLYCPQYGATAGWDYAPPLKTQQDMEKFVGDGWKSTNVWFMRDMEGLPQKS